MNLEKYRRPDGSIDLVAAHKAEHKNKVIPAGVQFLQLTEHYHKVRSRQVAALALAQADYILLISRPTKS